MYIKLQTLSLLPDATPTVVYKSDASPSIRMKYIRGDSSVSLVSVECDVQIQYVTRHRRYLSSLKRHEAGLLQFSRLFDLCLF